MIKMGLEGFSTGTNDAQIDSNSISGNESDEHLEEKLKQARHLEEQGFDVELEKGFASGFRVDVYGVKGDTEVVIEVGKNTSEKLNWLDGSFDKVSLVPYWRDGQKVEGTRIAVESATINLTDETMDKVEDIQETFEVKPSKREVARRAFSEYLENRKEETEAASNQNNNGDN